MGTTSYASIPYPEQSSLPNVPADVQALATRIDTILSLALGGGATIPGGALNLSTLPGQIGSIQSTQNTQAASISTLTGRPTIQQAYIGQQGNFQEVAGSRYSDQTVQSLTVPSQTYTRLLLCYATSMWGWNNISNSLRSRLIYNGTVRTQAIGYGPNQTLSCFFAQTIAAGASSTITQTISVYDTTSSSTTAQTQEISPIIYAVALPWFGTTLTHPPSL